MLTISSLGASSGGQIYSRRFSDAEQKAIELARDRCHDWMETAKEIHSITTGKVSQSQVIVFTVEDMKFKLPEIIAREIHEQGLTYIVQAFGITIDPSKEKTK